MTIYIALTQQYVDISLYFIKFYADSLISKLPYLSDPHISIIDLPYFVMCTPLEQLVLHRFAARL